MSTLDLGILAHVDAGKTSLTERLLHAAGVIDEIGSVDDGSTQTDSLALERQRGITIKSAVVSFVVNGVTINLIDTPGHPDFIAEVERVLGVLDGAVLVVSAVEGVQAQTRVLMRTLRRLHIPTLIFVNKIDRGGADCDRVLRDISERLAAPTIPMGSVREQGTAAAGCTPYAPDDPGFVSRLVELLAEHDEALLAAYVNDEAAVPYGRLRDALADQVGRALVHPVFFGSAITGAGLDALTAGVTRLLPSADGDADCPVSGTVFKVERGPAGERIAYLRVFSGTVRVRDRLRLDRGKDDHGKSDRDKGEKVTSVSVFERGSAVRRDSVSAGQIGKLWGLGNVRIGDTVGERTSGTAYPQRHFAPPTLETVVVPARPGERGPLHAALTQLAEQDPLINLRQDDIRGELYLSLYGEVQKEVIQATLANDFGIAVTFRETSTICVERPIGTGSSAEFMGDQTNPFRATIGLRISPAPLSTGVEFGLEVELGSLPYSFVRAVEETVRQTLRQGIHGWQVTDCTVSMTHSGYTPPPPYGWSSASSSAGDFRNLTPLVLMNALQQAGTRVYEPMHHFQLELPQDALGSALPVLSRLHAVARTTVPRGPSWLVEGEIPAARVHELQQLLPALTRGEGVLEHAFDHYRQVRGEVPTRPRSDHNPLNRKEYLLHVLRPA